MSNLYARLRAVSAQAKEAEKKSIHRKPCAVIRREFPMDGFFALTDRDIRKLCELEGVKPVKASDLIFLDTETTGLGRGAGTVAFLVGVGWIEGDVFICEQYWMRNYDEEEDLLIKINELLAGEKRKVAVSFNGKSFDIPLLEGRCVMNRMRLAPFDSLDLLTHARRVYKLRLKSVRLSQLEERVLGEERHDDIPGAEVPQRYFDFLKTGDRTLLDAVFEHNAIDVFSMSKILHVLARAYDEPQKLRHVEDIFSVGRAYERCGDNRSAESCYTLSRVSYKIPSVERLSMMYKRAGRLDEAVAGFCEIARDSVSANIELAKYYEHKAKDFAAALDCTDKAIAMTDGDLLLEDLFKRRRRLIYKMNKQ